MIVYQTGVFRTQSNIYDGAFCENSLPLKGEGELCILLYFIYISYILMS